VLANQSDILWELDFVTRLPYDPHIVRPLGAVMMNVHSNQLNQLNVCGIVNEVWPTTLAQLYQTTGSPRFTLEDVVAVAKGVGSVLSTLHGTATVHNNIVEESILVDGSRNNARVGRVGISDFGHATSEGQLFDENMLRRRRAYTCFPPEDYSTSHGDVFSLAVVLLRMLDHVDERDIIDARRNERYTDMYHMLSMCKSDDLDERVSLKELLSVF